MIENNDVIYAACCVGYGQYICPKCNAHLSIDVRDIEERLRKQYEHVIESLYKRIAEKS